MGTKSDFAGARERLEDARDLLCGDDETSHNAREALDLLIESVMVSEFLRSRDTGEIVKFHRQKRLHRR